MDNSCNQENLRSLQEQESGEAHIFHRSVFPLLWQIIMVVVLSVLLFYIFSLFFNASLAADVGAAEQYVFANNLAFVLLNLLIGIWVIYSVLRWVGDVYVINPRGLIIRHGIITYHEQIIGLVVVPTVQVEQSFLGKIFRYGNVRIIKAVGESDFILVSVPDPDHVAFLIKQVGFNFVSQRNKVLP